MFGLAIFIGIYSYILFFLGLSGLLYEKIIFLMSLVYTAFVLFFYLKFGYVNFKFVSNLKLFEKLLVGMLLLLVIVNLVGALGPELAFDALWYHLTIPKIYLLEHKVFYIPGGLLYYSAMPKLIDMLYVAGLSFGNEILPKLIHFMFGIFSLIALYKLSRKYFSKTIALLVLVIFYSNLVVAWESTTAYIDLGRTFFEIMALWAFLLWEKNRSRKDLILSAIMIGLAISSKLLALGSLTIFSILIIYKTYMTIRTYTTNYKNKFKQIVTSILVYQYTSILVILPWLLFSYMNTGNPVHPFFSSYKMDFDVNIFSLVNFSISMKELFLFADDPISPIYLICVPLLIFAIKRFRVPLKLISVYSLLALLIWYFTPRTGGGRFILPYLPAFSLLIGEILYIYRKQMYIYRFLVGIIIIIACTTILYRGVANYRYLPVIIGSESKAEFLGKNLIFSYGDFYDVDGYFSTHIMSSDKVLLYGFHNLYYVNFPFIDSSYVKKGVKYNYIATQHTSLPKQFAEWSMIYENKKTGVRLYSNDRK